MAIPAPDLHIPISKAVVQVSIIDTTARIDGIPTDGFLLPNVTGYDYLSCPAFSFIIEHSAGKKVLFDLGVRKDWENFSPALYKRLTSYSWQIVVQKDVRDILEEEKIDLQEIDAIIWRFLPTILQFAVNYESLPISQLTIHSACIVTIIGITPVIHLDFPQAQI